MKITHREYVRRDIVVPGYEMRVGPLYRFAYNKFPEFRFKLDKNGAYWEKRVTDRIPDWYEMDYSWAEENFYVEVYE